MKYNRIKEIIVREGRTNKEVAEYLGLSRQAVSTWCRNVNQPDIPTLFLLAAFLEVEARELLNETKDLADPREKPKKKTGKKK